MNQYTEIIEVVTEQLNERFNTLGLDLEDMTAQDLKPFVELFHSGVSSIRALSSGPEAERAIETLQTEIAPYILKYLDLTGRSIWRAESSENQAA